MNQEVNRECAAGGAREAKSAKESAARRCQMLPAGETEEDWQGATGPHSREAMGALSKSSWVKKWRGRLIRVGPQGMWLLVTGRRKENSKKFYYNGQQRRETITGQGCGVKRIFGVLFLKNHGKIYSTYTRE